MFTLSDASKDTKEIIKWGGLFIVGIVVALMLFRVVLFVKELILPTPPPKPTVLFGKLQPQSFLQNATSQKLTYSINTLTGELPGITDQVKVYRMKEIQPDLLAVNKFEDKVKNVGFAAGSTAISDKVFEWQSYQYLTGVPTRIRVNIVNYDFTITSQYMSDAGILSGKNLPDKTRAVEMAKGMLTDMQLLPEDVDLSKTKTNLFSIKNNSLSPSTSLSNSQIVEVDFIQKDIDKLPIYYQNPNASNLSILIGGGADQPQIVGATYINQQISDQYSTYPIKTVKQAYDELQKGNAYIASYFGTSPNVAISNVFPAYYIGSQTQDFLMPVIVFGGNDGFYAYVPAVTDEWINR